MALLFGSILYVRHIYGLQCALKAGSLAEKIYGTDIISERHRHRYEFNNDYLDAVEAAGMTASGRNPDTGLVEIVEIPSHPFFIGVQFHPEAHGGPLDTAYLFDEFIKLMEEK